MPNNDTSIFNMGRVPKYLGNFEDNHNYRIYNIVSYVESCFISVSDNNANVPVSLTRDSSGYLESYTLNTGWDFLMNGLDSSIAMSNAIKECINAKNQAVAKEAFISGNLTEDRNWNRAKQFAGNDRLIELKSWESGREERLQREADETRRIQAEAPSSAYRYGAGMPPIRSGGDTSPPPSASPRSRSDDARNRR